MNRNSFTTLFVKVVAKIYKVVGTSGLGYPLLLCLGLVVILDYIRTAGPLRTGALFT